MFCSPVVHEGCAFQGFGAISTALSCSIMLNKRVGRGAYLRGWEEVLI